MGKGGRCPETRTGRYARCETPKPSWGSSARGGTLESRVLRKAHARFGEERMEKCSRSNSPAAYSTSTTAVRRGTSSPIGPGSSCPSDCATGLTGSDQWDLVLLVREWLRLRLGVDDGGRRRAILFVDHLLHHRLVQGAVPFRDRDRRDPVADQIGDGPGLIHEPVDAEQENEAGDRDRPDT